MNQYRAEISSILGVILLPLLFVLLSSVFAAPFLADPSIGVLELVVQDTTKLVLPEGLAFDAFGNLFVTLEINSSEGGVAYVDKDSGSVTQLVRGISRADAISLLPDGDLLVTSEVTPASTANRLYRLKVTYDANNVPVSASASSLTTTLAVNNPEGIAFLATGGAFGNAGAFFVAEDANPGRILRIALDTGASQIFVDVAAMLNRPEGLALGDFNGALTPALYTPETGANRIRRLESDGTTSVFGDPTTVGLTFPDGLTFGPDGFLYVAEDIEDGTDHGRIIRIAADGTHTVFAGGLKDPSAVAFDPTTGHLYIAEQATSSIWRVKFNGQCGITLPCAKTLVVTAFTISPSGFKASFNRPVERTVLSLYNTEPDNFGPPDVTVTGTVQGSVRGSLLVNPVGNEITFIRTAGVFAPDTYTVTLRSAADAFKSTTGGPLDGNGDGTAGDNYQTSFTITASNAVVLSIPDFARGAGQSVNIPATSSGIPITISNGAGIQSVDFILKYDPALLTVTSAIPGASLPAGSQIQAILTTLGEARVKLTSAIPLGTGSAELVRLTAQVPTTAPYGTAQILHMTNVAVNGGLIAAVGDDGLHVAAYFGDATENRSYSSLDGQRVLRVAAGLDSGFAPFITIDPVVIADISGNGSIGSLDATRILQEVVGIDRPEIPPIPQK